MPLPFSGNSSGSDGTDGKRARSRSENFIHRKNTGRCICMHRPIRFHQAILLAQRIQVNISDICGGAEIIDLVLQTFFYKRAVERIVFLENCGSYCLVERSFQSLCFFFVQAAGFLYGIYSVSVNTGQVSVGLVQTFCSWAFAFLGHAKHHLLPSSAHS